MKKIYKNALVVLSIVMILSVFTGCGTVNDQIISVKTAAAQKQALDSNISVNGVLLPASTVNVASKLAGSFQITAINVEVGSAVKVGETLATLDTAQLNAQLTQAEAQLNAANVAVNGAKSSKTAASSAYSSAKSYLEAAKAYKTAAQAYYDSIKDTGTADAIAEAYSSLQGAKNAVAACQSALAQSSAAKTNANNAVNTTEANVDVFEAGVDLINLQIANATVLSPVTGVVISKNVNVGEMAAPSVALFTVADESNLKLKGTVSQDVLPSISEGQSVDVSVDIYPGTVYKGTITLIAPIAVSTGEYFPIEISLPNSSGLKPGLSASAAISVSGAQNIIVPLAAVLTEDGASYVYVLSNGTAVKKVVTTGLSNTNSIEILSGLEVGEKVITSNVSILSDGMQVNEQNGDKS